MMRNFVKKKKEPATWNSHDDFSKGRIKGSLLRQLVLGGQDGLVTVLCVILGVAVATGEARLALIAGIAAAFAETVSMVAVAYTSAKAQREFFAKRVAEETWET